MNRVVAAVLLFALSLTACSGGGGDDDTFVLELEGRAEVVGAGSVAAGEHRLAVGDVVRITHGVARLGVPGRRSLELRAGARDDDDSRVLLAKVPTLIDGHALVVAGDGETVRLRAGRATIALHDGAARVRRSTGVNLAVYEGSADVESLGQMLPRPLQALRQVAVADTGALPRRVLPLVYDRDALDPWDRRYLGPAIELGGQLDRASLALSRELLPPASGPDAEYLRTLVPALRDVPDFGAPLLADRRTTIGETMVGTSIALGGDGSFAERWDETFDFREQGADWGLVALDQDARRDAVVGVLDGVLDAVAARLPTFAVGDGDGDGGLGGGFRSTPTTTIPGADPTSPLPTSPGDDDEAPTVPDPAEPPPLVTIPPLFGEPEPRSPTTTAPEPSDPTPDEGLLGPVTNLVDGLADAVDGLLGPLLGDP